MITNFELFFERLKEASNSKTDKDLADYLEIGKTTLSMWKKRKKVDFELLLTKFEHQDLNWIFRGEKTKITTTNKNFSSLTIEDKLNFLYNQNIEVLKSNENIFSAIEKLETDTLIETIKNKLRELDKDKAKVKKES